MSAPNESIAQLQLDGPGKKVRTLEILTQIAGVSTVVECQVMALMGPDGEIIIDFATGQAQRDILAELRAIRKLLANVHGVTDFGPE